ncbi:MAG: PAS domain S-box protein [Phycisphaerae bacterium]|nr:PAS domain S-box protein [Phycisphaerae bacterium]
MTTLAINPNPRILVVDDSVGIHKDFYKILGGEKGAAEELAAIEKNLFGEPNGPAQTPRFEVHSAYQGEEALNLVTQAVAAGRPFAMVFMDVRMPPGWDGIETTEKIWAVQPDLQVVICTAYSDYTLEEMTRKLGRSDRMLILKKPFDTVEVMQLACALTEKWRLTRESTNRLNDLETTVGERTRELRTVNEQLRGQVEERRQAEVALRESETRFRQLFENIGSGVAVYEAVGEGKDFVFKDFNAAGEKIEGLKRKQVVGRRLTEVFPGVEPFGLLEILERVWRTGKSECMPAGLYEDARICGWRENYIYKLPSGEVVAVYEDATERVRAEEALRQSEEQHRTLVENLNMGIYRTTGGAHGRFLQANPALAAMHGFASVDEMMKVQVSDLFERPEDRRRFVEEALEGGGVRNKELRLRKKDGTLFWASCTAKVECDGEGRIKWLDGAIEDVTERRAVEQALRESEAKYRTLYDFSQDAILILTPDLKFVTGNPASVAMTGCRDEKELVGLSVVDMSPERQPDGQPSADRLRQIVAMAMERGSHSFEWKCRRLGDGEFLASITLTRVQIHGRELLQVTVRDITREKEVDRMKSEFVSIASHELRTPLTNIQEAISQVMDGLYGEMPTEQRAVLGIAHRNCQRLGRIVSDFLDLSRIESGRLVIRKAALSVANAADRVARQFREAVRKKSISLTVRAEHGLARAMADPDRLEQILVNLIGNAVKFTPEGGDVSVDTTMENGWIRCSVADTGVGMTPDELRQLFTKFKRFGATGGSDKTGAGLGLVIAKHLVELHGGEIEVQSHPGRGSRFTFRLPDYRSERVFRDALAKKHARMRAERGDVTVLGVKVENWGELAVARGPGGTPFFDELAQALEADLPAGVNLWGFEEQGEFALILGAGTGSERRKTSDLLMASLAKHRFATASSVRTLQISIATTTSLRDAPSGWAALDELRRRWPGRDSEHITVEIECAAVAEPCESHANAVAGAAGGGLDA